MRWGSMDWIDLAEDRDHWRPYINTVLNLRVPQNIRKFLSSCASRAHLHEVSYLVGQSVSAVSPPYWHTV
jgi:hypothetical protein